MLYVGLDVHMSRSSLCILNDAGAVVNRQEVKGPWSKLLESLRCIAQPFSLCYEASCGYGHLYDQIRPLAHHVAVAHPGKLRLIYRSKRKNDRVDAEKLAKLLLLDMVPAVHVPRVDVRNWRSLIVWRQRLIDKRVSCKNQIRAALREAGVPSPKGKSLWTKKAIAWLEGLPLDAVGTIKVQMSQEEMKALNHKIKLVESELAKISDRHPGVALLQTIKGVGIRTAEAFCAWVDDVTRFRRNRQLGAYFGLVPCQDSSAERNRLGHITREGPSVMRKLLTEATWMSVKLCPHLRAFFERVMGGKPERRKIALVATSHHLVRVMGAMLRTGEVYNPDRAERGGEGGRSGETPIRPQAVLSAPPTPTSPLSGFPSSPGQKRQAARSLSQQKQINQ
jgi:transposase